LGRRGLGALWAGGGGGGGNEDLGFRGIRINGLCSGQPNGLKCLSGPARYPDRAEPGPASICVVSCSCRAKITCFVPG
jgi:hypothetical protein